MRGLNRREFIASTLALGSSYVWGAAPKSLDPIDPYMRFGITGALWGDWPNGNLRMSTDMQQIVSDTARFGLQGIEPYARQLGDYVAKPLALKQLCEASGISLIDVGDLPPAQPSHQGGCQSLDQPEGNGELIAAMVNFAHDFLAPCGCDHWKTNMGSRPEEGQATISSRHSPTPSMKSAGKPSRLASGSPRILISGDPWKGSGTCAGDGAHRS